MPKLIKPAYLLHKATGQARCRINRKDRYWSANFGLMSRVTLWDEPRLTN